MLRYSLTDDDGGRFRVDPVGRLYKAKPTNYETQQRHVIRANVSDNGSPALSVSISNSNLKTVTMTTVFSRETITPAE